MLKGFEARHGVPRSIGFIGPGASLRGPGPAIYPDLVRSGGGNGVKTEKFTFSGPFLMPSRPPWSEDGTFSLPGGSTLPF